MNGFLAVWIPQFPLQALRWAAPGRAWERGPHAVMEERGPVRVVVAADARARCQGVASGLTEPQSRFLAAKLIAHDRACGQEQRLQVWMSEQVEGVSDRCQWLPPGRWLLHLAGMERLLGGEAAIAQQLRARLRAARLEPALGVAATRSAALLAAHAAAAMPGCCWILPGRDTAAALGRLPLAALRGLEGCSLADTHTAQRAPAKKREQDPRFCLEIFVRWGLKTLGDLAALPRRGLAERLGAAGLGWQRWARGEDTGLLVPSRKPEAPSAAEQGFDPPLEDYFQLLPWLEQQCQNECRRLERLDRAVDGIEAELELAARAGASEVMLRSPNPAPGRHRWRWEQTLQVPHRDAKRLSRQMEIALATRPPAAAIAAARICFRIVQPKRIQPRLFGEAEVERERTDRLLARLRELLEDRDGTRVGSAQLCDLHRRDAFTVVPFAPERLAAEPTPAPGSGAGTGLCLRAFRPPPPIRLRFACLPVSEGSFLLEGALCDLPPASAGRCPERQPASIAGRRSPAVQSGAAQPPALRVLHASGPWRTSGEWWRDTCWSGDEWEVELSNGRLYRLLHDRKARAWFLAGEYD